VPSQECAVVALDGDGQVKHARAPDAAVAHHAEMAAMRAGAVASLHSRELVTAVDGPGTRLTLFLSGCLLRC
jgi:pyruvate formate lyase activating enzyme